MITPALKYWKKLYEASMDFKKTSCWEWMNDRDIFGVQDPVSGEIGYCVVLGSMGEVFALAVYRGTEGLLGITKIHAEMSEQEIEESMQMQNCLIASFEDRKDLQDKDREIIKKLDLKFRGRKQWPLYRSLIPGYVPWFLNKEEIVFLTVALQQASDVVLRLKKNPDLLTSPNAELYFVRLAEKKGKKTTWSDGFIKPESNIAREIPAYMVDELRLRRIKKAPFLRGLILEIDFFYAPYPVQEQKGQRPYFPYLCLLVDQKSGVVLKHSLAKHEELTEVFCENFLSMLEDSNMIPSSILVKRELAWEMLAPLTNLLDIEIKMVERLKMMDEVRGNMFAYLSQ